MPLQYISFNFIQMFSGKKEEGLLLAPLSLPEADETAHPQHITKLVT